MRNHSFTTTTEFNMGNPHTLMRSDAEQAARMMGLDFKIDAILNGHAEEGRALSQRRVSGAR